MQPCDRQGKLRPRAAGTRAAALRRGARLRSSAEARSCERFRLLSLHIAEEDLKEFYHRFMVSEAGHYRLFLDLAMQYFDEEKVKKRWQEYLAYEAEVMKKLELRGDRMH